MVTTPLKDLDHGVLVHTKSHSMRMMGEHLIHTKLFNWQTPVALTLDQNLLGVSPESTNLYLH